MTDFLSMVWSNPPYLVATVITIAAVITVSGLAHQYMRMRENAMAVALAGGALAMVGIALVFLARAKGLS